MTPRLAQMLKELKQKANSLIQVDMFFIKARWSTN